MRVFCDQQKWNILKINRAGVDYKYEGTATKREAKMWHFEIATNFWYWLVLFNNPWIVPQLSKRMPKTAWKNLLIRRFHTGKPDFWDFLDLGVPCSILMLLTQTNYWVQTKMWYFLACWELLLKDGSCLITLATTKFG